MAPALPSWKNHIIITVCDIGTPIAKLCVFFYSSQFVDLKIFLKYTLSDRLGIEMEEEPMSKGNKMV